MWLYNGADQILDISVKTEASKLTTGWKCWILFSSRLIFASHLSTCQGQRMALWNYFFCAQASNGENLWPSHDCLSLCLRNSPLVTCTIHIIVHLKKGLAHAYATLSIWCPTSLHVLLKAHFPVEVRFVKRDDIMLSPSGECDVTYIGIISYRCGGCADCQIVASYYFSVSATNSVST